MWLGEAALVLTATGCSSDGRAGSRVVFKCSWERDLVGLLIL